MDLRRPASGSFHGLKLLLELNSSSSSTFHPLQVTRSGPDPNTLLLLRLLFLSYSAQERRHSDHRLCWDSAPSGVATRQRVALTYRHSNLLLDINHNNPLPDDGALLRGPPASRGRAQRLTPHSLRSLSMDPLPLLLVLVSSSPPPCPRLFSSSSSSSLLLLLLEPFLLQGDKSRPEKILFAYEILIYLGLCRSNQQLEAGDHVALGTMCNQQDRLRVARKSQT